MEKITKTRWGYYDVLYEEPGVKVKKLYIDVDKELSNQRHFKRSEHWFILQGHLKLILERDNIKFDYDLHKGDSIDIEVGTWHYPINGGNEPVVVIETQYGEDCVEEDIERKEWKKLED